MRVAVYDRYWSTMGGGEQVAAGIAEVLALDDTVDLLTPEPIDRDRLEERLGVDLSRCGELLVGPSESSVAAASLGYDLLVNTTYLSNAVVGARWGLYYVHFPGTPPTPADRRRRRVADELNRRARRPHIGWSEGFHEPDTGWPARWTNGLARADVWMPGGGELRFTVDVDPWPAGARPRARIRVGRDVVLDAALDRGPHVVSATIPDHGPLRPVPVVIASDHFLPVEAFGVPDSRQLGLRVSDVHLAGIGAGLADRRPAWARPPSALSFVDSYDVIASNSQYTAGWVERLWGRSSEVLHPPVHRRPSGAKREVIVSVGRFFDAASGHSKKQLEMAQAFRRLVEVHGARGWELHLVGGCDARYRDYAMAVRRELQGLPAEVHFNAPGEDLAALLSEASIYWHAGGMGEDLDVHPDRAEHFGIAVVEAMFAGAVPIVFAAAGPAEVVRPGVDGLHVRSVDELASATAGLVADGPRRRRLASSAADRAEAYGIEAFARRLRSLVDEVCTAPAGTDGRRPGTSAERRPS